MIAHPFQERQSRNHLEQCKGLEVRVCDGADVVLAKFWVDAGVWQPRLED